MVPSVACRQDFGSAADENPSWKNHLDNDKARAAAICSLEIDTALVVRDVKALDCGALLEGVGGCCERRLA